MKVLVGVLLGLWVVVMSFVIYVVVKTAAPPQGPGYIKVVAVKAPASVKPGEPFHIVIGLRNKDLRPHMLHSIELDAHFGMAAAVQSTTPPCREVQPTAHAGYRYVFGLPMQPEQVVPLRFDFVAPAEPTELEGVAWVNVDSVETDPESYVSAAILHTNEQTKEHSPIQVGTPAAAAAPAAGAAAPAGGGLLPPGMKPPATPKLPGGLPKIPGIK